MNYSEIAVEAIECMSFLSRKTLQELPRGAVGGEMGILVYLSGDERGVASGELSRVMNVSTGRVAAALKSLERKKYIMRLKDENDKRKVIVKITPDGQKYALARYEKTVKNVEDIMRELGDEDAAEAVRLLHKIKEKMQHSNNLF